MIIQNRIKRLEQKAIGNSGHCPHTLTLTIDGKTVRDDAPCFCGGERLCVVVNYGHRDRREDTNG